LLVLPILGRATETQILDWPPARFRPHISIPCILLSRTCSVHSST
jgi:hypothetical protein